ncbi:MAG: hypothetical protein WDM87_11570 [Terracidiphilus sp.]
MSISTQPTAAQSTHPLSAPPFTTHASGRASIGQPGDRGYSEYFAFFNLADTPATLRATWQQLGLDSAKHAAHNVWDDSTAKESKEISVTLPPHGCALFEAQ